MRKTLLTVLVGASLLAIVSTASARSLSSTNQNLRVTWASLEFVGSFGVTVRCPLTLEGSFHSRSINKVTGSLIGSITRALIGEAACTGGTARAKTLPWHISYEGFVGTLPNINAVRALIRGYRAEVIVAGACTGDYGATTDNITGSAIREAGGAITALQPIEGRNTVTLVRTNGGICPASGAMHGSASVTVLSSSNRITITLI